MPLPRPDPGHSFSLQVAPRATASGGLSDVFFWEQAITGFLDGIGLRSIKSKIIAFALPE